MRRVLQHGIHDLRVNPDTIGSDSNTLLETSATATGEMAKLSVVRCLYYVYIRHTSDVYLS